MHARFTGRKVRLTDGEFMKEINSRLLAINGLEPSGMAVKETLKFPWNQGKALRKLDEE